MAILIRGCYLNKQSKTCGIVLFQQTKLPNHFRRLKKKHILHFLSVFAPEQWRNGCCWPGNGEMICSCCNPGISIVICCLGSGWYIWGYGPYLSQKVGYALRENLLSSCFWKQMKPYPSPLNGVSSPLQDNEDFQQVRISDGPRYFSLV